MQQIVMALSYMQRDTDLATDRLFHFVDFQFEKETAFIKTARSE
jgi:hypothetical protein